MGNCSKFTKIKKEIGKKKKKKERGKKKEKKKQNSTLIRVSII